MVEWEYVSCCIHCILRSSHPPGYIAIDGTSLTVTKTTADSFSVMLIQYTQSKVVLGSKKVGEKVNLEVRIHVKHA